MKWCHVTAHDWATWHHTIYPKYATCQNRIHPPVNIICTVNMKKYLPHNCTIVRPVQSNSTSTLYRLYELHNHQILHVWKNEQIAISFAYGVCLCPFKLRWVHNDEAYAHARFEVILSSLIFRPSWIHFGLFLPTKTFWSSKRILTNHQVRDRPPHLFLSLNSILCTCLIKINCKTTMITNNILLATCTQSHLTEATIIHVDNITNDNIRNMTTNQLICL
jgi:hypothetical protein